MSCGRIIGVIKLWAMVCEGAWVFPPDGSLGVVVVSLVGSAVESLHKEEKAEFQSCVLVLSTNNSSSGLQYCQDE